MRTKYNLLCLLILSAAILVSGSAVSAGDGNGGYAGSWLQMPIGARPTGMGGAYVGVSDDGAGPLFNPAGISGLSKPLLSSSYRAMQLDRKLGYVAALFPVQGNAVLGAHWLFAGSGTVMGREGDFGLLTGEELSNNSHQFSIVFAKRFEDWLSLGANLSYLYSRMPEFSAVSVGFDFGAMIYFDQLKDREAREDMKINDIQFGLVIKNIAKRFKWNSENYNVIHEINGVGVEQEDKFPIEVNIGGSAKFFERKLMIASDLRVRQYLGAALHVGAEYRITESAAFRSGYSDGRFTAGTGYLFPIGSKTLTVDYAFTTDKADEGSEHIFSIDFQF